MVPEHRRRAWLLQAVAPGGEVHYGDGRTVEFESQAGSNLAPKVGQQVTVLYDPLKPEEAKLKSFMMLWALPSILTALGVFLLFPGLLMLFVLVLILAL